MKLMRTIFLMAVPALVLSGIGHAQTPPVSPDASSNANAPYSADPLIQKRQADSVAKAEYKARKKAAKMRMKAEKKEAKAALKAQKAESTGIRNKALAEEPVSK
jgi:hypothetical protein